MREEMSRTGKTILILSGEVLTLYKSVRIEIHLVAISFPRITLFLLNLALNKTLN